MIWTLLIAYFPVPFPVDYLGASSECATRHHEEWERTWTS